MNAIQLLGLSLLAPTLVNALIILETTVPVDSVVTDFTDTTRHDRIIGYGTILPPPITEFLGDHSAIQWTITPAEGYYFQFTRPEGATESRLLFNPSWISSDIEESSDFYRGGEISVSLYSGDSFVSVSSSSSISPSANFENTYFRILEGLSFDSLTVSSIVLYADYSSFASLITIDKSPLTAFTSGLTVLSYSDDPESLSSAFSMVPIAAVPEPSQFAVILSVILTGALIHRRRASRLG
jgi:hypothetical protein